MFLFFRPFQPQNVLILFLSSVFSNGPKCGYTVLYFFYCIMCLYYIHCTGITFHMHHIVTDKEPVLISICIQYMKCSFFILIDVICYCLHTKSVLMKFKSDIYI